MSRRIRLVVLDLDGVIRHFDPGLPALLEREHDLELGLLLATASAPDLYDPLVTGRLRRHEWIELIGQRIGAPEAARRWGADRGSVDDAVLATVDEVRATGVPVAVLTNGSDTTPAEMQDLGIDRRVDAVFNSAETGVAKPDEAAFRMVCDAFERHPAEVFFTDDSPSKMTGAVAMGIDAVPFVGVQALRVQLRSRDLLAPIGPESPGR